MSSLSGLSVCLRGGGNIGPALCRCRPRIGASEVGNILVHEISAPDSIEHRRHELIMFQAALYKANDGVFQRAFPCLIGLRSPAPRSGAPRRSKGQCSLSDTWQISSQVTVYVCSARHQMPKGGRRSQGWHTPKPRTRHKNVESPRCILSKSSIRGTKISFVGLHPNFELRNIFYRVSVLRGDSIRMSSRVSHAPL